MIISINILCFSLVCLEVVYEDVGDPQVLDELQVHRYVLWVGAVRKLGVDIQPRFLNTDWLVIIHK